VLSTGPVLLGAEAADWRSAVRLSGQLLVESGAVTPEYVDCMVQTVETYGAYIVIAPGIAIPHASAARFVLKPVVGVVILRRPVSFSPAPRDQVDIMFPIASAVDDEHLHTLSLLCESLARPRVVESLRQASTRDEVLSLLR
jgi:mannitol/fructose-specific phosphotransferase system IIA component (Ntr-type)